MDLRPVGAGCARFFACTFGFSFFLRFRYRLEAGGGRLKRGWDGRWLVLSGVVIANCLLFGRGCSQGDSKGGGTGLGIPVRALKGAKYLPVSKDFR